LSQYGIDVPPPDQLWIADAAESRATRDKWIPEWDQIYRARKPR